MRLGMPTRAGTSKAPMARMNTNSASARIAGMASRMEMRQTVCSTLAPLVRAASSMSALAARKVEPSSRNTSGDHRNPSIRTIPAIDCTWIRLPLPPSAR